VLLTYAPISISSSSSSSSDFTGPSFLLEPPGKFEFSNTTGAWIDCTAAGHPAPHIRWLTSDGTPVPDVPSLRQDMSNGTLALLPFPPAMYRQDVHSSVYRCLATNDVGAIVSRDVHVRAGKSKYQLCNIISSHFQVFFRYLYYSYHRQITTIEAILKLYTFRDYRVTIILESS